MSEAIKPCLFCGKEQDGDSFHYNGSGPPPSYSVECGWCGARGSSGLGSGRADHEGAKRVAVERWNSARPTAVEIFAFALTDDLAALRDEVMKLDDKTLGVVAQAAFNLSQIADLVYAFRGNGLGPQR